MLFASNSKNCKSFALKFQKRNGRWQWQKINLVTANMHKVKSWDQPSVHLRSPSAASPGLSFSLDFRYDFKRCLYELTELVSLPYSSVRSTYYSNAVPDNSVIIPRCYNDFYVNRFLPRILCFQNDFLWLMI